VNAAWGGLAQEHDAHCRIDQEQVF
jgi:hypothetical protein